MARPPADLPAGRVPPAPRTDRPAAPPPDGSRTALLITLVAVAAGLLTASRFMVFEGTNGYAAVAVGWSTPNWLVQVALPLLVAVALLASRRGPPAVTTACGVLAGVVLTLLSQLVMAALVVLLGHVGYTPGPAWWPLLAAALVLGAASGLGLRGQRQLRERPVRRRDGRAATGAAVVVVTAVGWVLAGPVSTDYGWWLYLRVPGLLLAVLCLALTALRLSAPQRRYCLAAVTTFAAWLAEMAAEGLAAQPAAARPAALLVSLAAVLLWVASAYVVQSRDAAGERRPVTTG